MIFHELVARRVGIQTEPPNQRQRNDKSEESKQIADDAMRVFAVARHEQQQQRSHQRCEQHHRQDMSIVKFHLPASPSSSAISFASAPKTTSSTQGTPARRAT